ncbi:MAG: hypothetical protein HKM94_05490 [Halobacteria archaeon]|nr:hypothetical protein [Halobacteria archaeon]NNG13687.1 hypothetical protein [Gammaproteobacteria bacterium]
MTAQVTLYQSQITFEASESENLLTAALRAGLNVDYVFNELKTGQQIAVESPSGDFTLVDDMTPAQSCLSPGAQDLARYAA